MAGRNPQTMSKRARELAVKERRDRKRAQKAENAANRGTEAEAGAETEGADEETATDVADQQ